MARTGSVGGGSISPFGTGGVDFGAFDQAASKSVSLNEQAALEFDRVRARWQQGLITNAVYLDALRTYYNGLDPNTSGGISAQYTISNAEYTLARNTLVQDVQTGAKPSSDLVAYDRAALLQTIPGSDEYNQRQDRLFTSQSNFFGDAEADVLDQLSHGRITNTQAADWYRNQATLYADNPTITANVTDKVAQLGDRILQEQDNAISDGWNKGTMTISQVIAYSQQVQHDSPGTERAANMAEFEHSARLQAVESSLKYRYDLTREYGDLQKFIASAASVNTGGTSGSTSVSHQTRTVWNGKKWVTITTATSTAHPGHGPTPNQVAANKKRLAEVAAAKKRLAAIKLQISRTPGGWATDQDYIANLTQQQALMQVGTPDWYALQQQIDGHKQRIEADKVLAKAGIKVAYKAVGSELSTDPNVGPTERPVGLTPSQIARAQTYQQQIEDYQRALDSGTLTPEQEAAYGGAIELAQRNLAGILTVAKKTQAARSASPPARSAATGGGGGGGMVAASTAARTGGPATTSKGTAKAGGGQFATKGPLQIITSSKVIPVRKYGDTVSTATKGVGLPKNSSASAFDDFHYKFVQAIKAGAASFTDPRTGAAYAVPTDAASRLEMLTYLDDTNVNLKYEELRYAAGKGVSASSMQSKQSAYNNAKANALTNRLYILDTSSPGVIRDEKGAATRLTEASGKDPVNTLAWAVDLMDVAKHHADQEFKLAKAAYDRGDYASAAVHLNNGSNEIDKVGAKLEGYNSQIQSLIGATVAAGGKVPDTLNKDLDRLAAWDTDLGDVAKPVADISAALFGTPQNPGSGILAMSNGVVATNGKGDVVLNPGFARTMDASGKVTAKRMNVVGYDTQHKPIYGESGKVHVQVKTGQSFVDVLAPYTVGSVGSLTDASGAKINVLGKIVTNPATGEVWTENPFKPGVWVPGGGVGFTMPKGATTFVNGAGAKSLPGVAGGTVGIAFGGGSGGNQNFDVNNPRFILVPDPTTGTFNLWQDTDQGPQELGAIGTDLGTANDQIAKILANAGFDYDYATLNGDQQFLVNLKTSGLNTTAGGAWFGATKSDLSTLFIRPTTNERAFTTTYAGSADLGRRAVGGAPDPFARREDQAMYGAAPTLTGPTSLPTYNAQGVLFNPNRADQPLPISAYQGDRSYAPLPAIPAPANQYAHSGQAGARVGAPVSAAALAKAKAKVNAAASKSKATTGVQKTAARAHQNAPTPPPPIIKPPPQPTHRGV